ncbi:hypothetical protein RND71_001501 [Anisodus tanguticus]|uniref:Serine-threonine/tyrosine-protein kinase catalytic domain-containing protein n=1 Tax=Anisodus tanguticus TaxID=243964 RepID=A0AAE1T123_9SOLA|nr:hypothetical protein RND71_001501 [Anisodus tanguticus]
MQSLFKQMRRAIRPGKGIDVDQHSIFREGPINQQNTRPKRTQRAPSWECPFLTRNWNIYSNIAPEYARTLMATPKGDVYIFGVVLLELVTERGSNKIISKVTVGVDWTTGGGRDGLVPKEFEQNIRIDECNSSQIDFLSLT